MNNIYDKDWEIDGIDGAVQNDWYIVPVVIVGVIFAFVTYVGVDAFIDVVSDFIAGIRAN